MAAVAPVAVVPAPAESALALRGAPTEPEQAALEAPSDTSTSAIAALENVPVPPGTKYGAFYNPSTLTLSASGPFPRDWIILGFEFKRITPFFGGLKFDFIIRGIHYPGVSPPKDFQYHQNFHIPNLRVVCPSNHIIINRQAIEVFWGGIVPKPPSNGNLASAALSRKDVSEPEPEPIDKEAIYQIVYLNEDFTIQAPANTNGRGKVTIDAPREVLAMMNASIVDTSIVWTLRATVQHDCTVVTMGSSTNPPFVWRQEYYIQVVSKTPSLIAAPSATTEQLATAGVFTDRLLGAEKLLKRRGFSDIRFYSVHAAPSPGVVPPVGSALQLNQLTIKVNTDKGAWMMASSGIYSWNSPVPIKKPIGLELYALEDIKVDLYNSMDSTLTDMGYKGVNYYYVDLNKPTVVDSRLTYSVTLTAALVCSPTVVHVFADK